MKTFLQTDTIYNRLLVSIKDCRMKCIEDTLSGTNPDLYNALYSDSDKLIYKTKLELYELKWIELHLKKMNEINPISILVYLRKKSDYLKTLLTPIVIGIVL